MKTKTEFRKGRSWALIGNRALLRTIDAASAIKNDPASTHRHKRIKPLPFTILRAVVLAVASFARAQTQTAAGIPFSGIGAKATAEYKGDALAVTAIPHGALLRCGFQKLEGWSVNELVQGAL